MSEGLRGLEVVSLGRGADWLRGGGAEALRLVEVRDERFQS